MDVVDAMQLARHVARQRQDWRVVAARLIEPGDQTVTAGAGGAGTDSEVVAASDDRTLFQAIWTLQAPANAGEPLVVRYRIDADQVLHLQLQRPAHPDQPETQLRIENPLTNVQNPILKEIEAERP